jgi:hypothetical protein
MARFVEFLKSGKSAKEFIDTAILPQNVLPVEQTEFSSGSYESEEEKTNTESTDAVLDSAADNPPESPAGEDKSVDFDNDTGQGLIEYGDEADPAFIAALDAAEKAGL